MPSSDTRGKPQILDFVRNLKHDRMLDIGCGEGTYAKLFPEAKWTGVEIWEPYVEQYHLADIYPDLHVMDAREWEPMGERWDVAVAGDVLEHMTEDEASALFDKLRSCADWVFISIPFNMPQGEWGGNPYERHVKDDWSHEEVKRVFGDPEWCHIDYPIGVYAWRGKDVVKERLKICVYAISKNEAHFVERFCNSAKDADLILIADTGSTDGLPEEARKHGAVVHDICVMPWRFDVARNASMALIPRDIDVCICLDIDEVLQPGWREEIERVWIKGFTTRLRYMFDWSEGIKFYSEKIHARGGYHWHHPCHEYAVLDKRVSENWAHTDKLLIVHMPDPTKSRGQYLELLDLSVKEDPNCPRNAFYYARELSFYGRWQESIDACKKYLQMPSAIWIGERAYAYRVIGGCYKSLGNFAEAEKFFHMAASEDPNTREPWCELAFLTYEQSRWEESFAYAMRALRIKERAMVYTCDPAVWGARPHDLAAIAAWNLGLKDIALEQAKLALSLEPDDKRLQDNVRFMSGEESIKDAA